MFTKSTINFKHCKTYFYETTSHPVQLKKKICFFFNFVFVKVVIFETKNPLFQENKDYLQNELFESKMLYKNLQK